MNTFYVLEMYLFVVRTLVRTTPLLANLLVYKFPLKRSIFHNLHRVWICSIISSHSFHDIADAERSSRALAVTGGYGLTPNNYVQTNYDKS